MLSSVVNVLLISVGTCALRISPTVAGCRGAVTVGVLVGTTVAVAVGAGMGVDVGGSAGAGGVGVALGPPVAAGVAVGGDGRGITARGPAILASMGNSAVAQKRVRRED